MIGIGKKIATSPYDPFTIIEHSERRQPFSVVRGSEPRHVVCFFAEAYEQCAVWVLAQPKRVN